MRSPPSGEVGWWLGSAGAVVVLPRTAAWAQSVRRPSATLRVRRPRVLVAIRVVTGEDQGVRSRTLGTLGAFR